MTRKFRQTWFGWAAAWLLGLTGAASAEEWLNLKPTGEFVIAKTLKGQIHHYGQGWSSHSAQNSESIIAQPAEKNSLKARFIVKEGCEFALQQKVDFGSPAAAEYSALVESAEGVPTAQLCLTLELPLERYAGQSVQVDDQPVLLPAEPGDGAILALHPAKRIALPLADGRAVLTGDWQVMIQDNRGFKMKSYSLRLNFKPGSGQVTRAEFAARISFEPFDAQPLDLRTGMNMGFKDEVADDGKGGWTDQGPQNDLRMLPVGRRRLGGLPFEIVDPQKNEGKSCLALRGPERDYFPAKVTIPAHGEKFRFLYLLHSAAWAKKEALFGTLRVTYADGTDATLQIQGKREVADWWSCYPISNGAVVWTGENQSAYVGLFMSKFSLADKPMQSLEFSSTGAAVWLVVGLTGCNEDVPLPKSMGEYYTIAGPNWRPFTHRLEVEPGSALDMTFLTEAPAGKYGRVINSGGHFAFADRPDRPVRFYGTNLCFTANYLEKAECEALAERLAALGYNSVRFHHHDGGLVNKDAPDSLTILPEQQDKLDYLFSCLKARGIYLTTDIYVSRYLKAAEVPELGKDSRGIKALVPVSDPVLANLKAFAKLFLEHVNPYTGLAWKDDPALFGISFVNENTLYETWGRDPVVRLIYEREFHRWTEEQKLSVDTDQKKAAALTRFITAMQIRSFTEMKKYVAGELGCQALYTDCNMSNFLCQTLARNQFDYVDNHTYWDHPRFPEKAWALPFGFHNRSVVRSGCSVPRNSMPTRIFGKPFIMTEFNYVLPNQYRGEGGLVMGALAALQDWDGIYRFAYAHTRENAVEVRPAERFDVATDPLALLAERIIALLYRRGDVQPARTIVPLVITPDCADVAGGQSGSGESFPNEYDALGLVHRIGSLVVGPTAAWPQADYVIARENLTAADVGGRTVFQTGEGLTDKLIAAGKLKPEELDLKNTGRARSDTGELTLDTQAGTFTVVTPRSEGAVLPAEAEFAGRQLHVSGNTAFATIFAASLDDQPLAAARRVLILHLTDINNTKMKFLDPQHAMLGNFGQLPHLVRAGRATLKLTRTAAGQPQAWALDITGKRQQPVEVKALPDGVELVVDTAAPAGSSLAYELVWP